MTTYVTWAYLHDLRGIYFQYHGGQRSLGVVSVTAMGYRQECLNSTGCRRSRSCWNHSPRHHCSGLDTPKRALKSRSDGKGQQTLSISKGWAKAQPFIHYWATRVTMQPFSTENLWPPPLSIVLISMKLKHVLRIQHFFAPCPQEREFPQLGPNMYFVRGIWTRRSVKLLKGLWRDIFSCSKSCFGLFTLQNYLKMSVEMLERKSGQWSSLLFVTDQVLWL